MQCILNGQTNWLKYTYDERLHIQRATFHIEFTNENCTQKRGNAFNEDSQKKTNSLKF